MASRKKQGDLLDAFSPEHLTRIVPTDACRRPDVFDSYRPQNPETMIDYNISETRLKCRYRGTQLNVRDTTASYLPKSEKDIEALKRMKRIIYSHGGPPKWKFADELWRERQEQTQVVHKRKFEELHERNRTAFSKSGRSRHKKAQRLAGPKWYQELSPKQIIAVNGLKGSLDAPTDAVDDVKEHLARLGLVPRPTSRKVVRALRHSCGRPVEFLLALYRLSTRESSTPVDARAKYSLNDRLLLSAVVHLSIGGTLKELHKRIPSPPRCYCERPRKVKVARRRAKCKSPYLEPYTFKPEPARFTGHYYDKHIQYPESPYFSYLFDLYIELSFSGNVADIDPSTITDEESRELVEETVRAQDIYAQVHCWEDVQFLVPTVLKHCGEYEALLETGRRRAARTGTPILPPLAILEPTKEPECTCEEIAEESQVCCEATIKCDCDECQCRTKTRLFVARLCERCERKKEASTARNLLEGTVTIRCDLSVPVIGGTFVVPTCDCMETYRNRLKIFEMQDTLRCQRVKYVISGGVVITKLGTVYCISTAVLNSRLRKLYASQRRSTVAASTDNDGTEEAPCTCKTEETRSDGTDDGKKECSCCVCEGSVESSTSSTDSGSSPCRCMEELKNVLEHKCTCEECIRKTREPTFIINDTVDTEGDGSFRVIEGVHEQHCDCLPKHLEKMRKLEEYKRRVQARFQLRKQIQKYSIGGVCDTPIGPVYAICGVRQPVRCICAELVEEERRLEEESRRRPVRPPEGRITYGIAGVAQAHDRNVFVYDQAMLAESCPCEVLFERFLLDHGACLRSFDEFLKTMANEIKLYAEEMGIDEGQSPQEEETSSSGEREGEEETSRSSAGSAQRETPPSAQRETPPSAQRETPPSAQRETLPSAPCCRCASSDSEESVAFDESYRIYLDPEDGSRSLKMTKEECEGGTSEQSENDTCTKRFVILKSFPKKSKKLMGVLKKVLNGLADDGFLLARLPECYKLPHFRLWLEMRTGKKWTREDRNAYLPISTQLYEHVSLCYKDARIPDLSAIRKAKHLTWTTANYWRDYAQKKKLCFYRGLKHRLIENTRELYPTRFAYEFYTPGYRDCFFAYSGGKEEDLCPYLN